MNKVGLKPKKTLKSLAKEGETKFAYNIWGYME